MKRSAGEWESLLRRASAAPEDAAARPFVRVEPRDERAVSRVLAGASTLEDSPRRDELRARALIELGRPEEAVAATRASAVVRAEALLLSGRGAEALASLPRGSGERAETLRAAALLALGDARGARRAASRLRGAAAAAVAAVAARFLGLAAEAEASLDECARRRPTAAWPHCLRAAVREAEGDLGAARAALDRAVALLPRSARLRAESARLDERRGVINGAIASAEAAVRLAPSVEHRLLLAGLLDRWRDHARAGREYALALAASPGDATIAWSRAKALSAAGDLAGAAREGERASAMAPGEIELAAWAARAALAAGLGRRAGALRASIRRRFAGRAGARAVLRFLDGYAAMRGRRWSAAARAFDGAVAAADGAPIARRAAFYSRAARALAVRGPSRAAGLVLAGLGVDPPYSATVGDLRAVAGCRVVFNNVMGDEMTEFLRALCDDVRPVAYHQCNDEESVARPMLAEAARGSAVAFVTRGNAIVYGPLGSLMMERRAARGRAWSCRPGVSSLEFLHARHGRGAEAGFAAVDLRELAAGRLFDRSATTAVFWSTRAPESLQKRACRGISSAVGGSRVCLVFDHVVAQEPLRRPASGLEGMIGALGPSAIVYASPEAR